MTRDTEEAAREPAEDVPEHAEPLLLLDEAAEILSAEARGLLSAVDIRECLEFEPHAEARERIEEALRRDPKEPIRPLRARAKEHRWGHYAPRRRKPSGSEEYARFLLFHERRSRRLEERRGHGPSPRESEELAGEFYAPHHRAAMNGIPPGSWDTCSTAAPDAPPDGAA
jgi:hypothetical protein